MTGNLYFTKESAGHQRRLLIKVISESFLAVVVLMGNLCWLLAVGFWAFGGTNENLMSSPA
jgi:hypothetical protein